MNQEVVGPTRPQLKLGGVPKSTSQDKDGAAFDLASLDRMLHAAQGRITFGLSPLAQGLAFLDWAAHAGNAPFACLGLAQTAMRQWQRLFAAAADGPAIVPPLGDHRFQDPAWQERPFNLMHQSFLLAEEWWAEASTAFPGVSRSNQKILSFTIRQLVDIYSPSNIPWLNPEVLEATIAKGGRNFLTGSAHLLTDLQEVLGGRPCGPEEFRVGRDVAATPGKVTLRNELIELIQYEPISPRVKREPILIIPAWIMKYYILDLSPHNSLIRYLVSQGHTVFTISWRNPGSDLANTSMDDYRVKGVMAALDAITDICGGARIHACGYCLGGTLLAIAASTMARDGDDRLASVSLFCAQTDFNEAGELQLFITEDQIAFLTDVMSTKGYLDKRQMAGAFQFLRSNDLIWSRLIKTYLLGEREHPNDLMAWNADGTRLPARMQGDYLHRLFLEDELAEGHFLVEGRPIVLSDVHVPLFVVATETDHIAPWRSVYKIHLLNGADLTFILTSGGHNAGVVNEPNHPHRHFRLGHRPPDALYLGPDEWLALTAVQNGSWWPSFAEWLDARCAESADPPPLGSKNYPPLMNAPGSYVLED